MFHWKKQGQVFDLSKIDTPAWMQEQAQNPYTLEMKDCLRVYFNCRPKKDQNGLSKSYAGFVDLDKQNLSKILNISKKPILDHGAIGEFDEHGIMAGSVLSFDNEVYLYYVGWSRKSSVPYDWAIGLGKSQDNGMSFTRYGRGPIIGATNKEPFLQAGCSGILNVDGTYHLWYTSGIKWIEQKPKPESAYQIMHSTSKDGIKWSRDGKPIINEMVVNEAQASPSVIKFNNKWHMVFSYRHSTDFRNKERGYRLGYAWSKDLKSWNRDDSLLNLDVSMSGWDSEMICYPHFCRLDSKIYLFYCGNEFGKNGFGVAELTQSV